MSSQVRIAWPPLTPGIKLLLIVYGALFVVTLFSGTLGIEAWMRQTLYLSNEGLLGRLYLWQPLTYQLFHADFFHIFFNGLVLYSFGGDVERRWRSARALVGFVCLCGLGGAALIALSQLVFPGAVGPSGFGSTPTLGASGGIYGVVAAFSVYFWDRPMSLFLIPGQFKARWLLPIFFGLDVVMTVLGGAPISLAGHLGGLLTGLAVVLVRRGEGGALLDRWRLWKARRRLKVLRGGGHPLRRDDDDRPRYMN
jgi:membrane associated rhomboid family serine protease